MLGVGEQAPPSPTLRHCSARRVVMNHGAASASLPASVNSIPPHEPKLAHVAVPNMPHRRQTQVQRGIGNRDIPTEVGADKVIPCGPLPRSSSGTRTEQATRMCL